MSIKKWRFLRVWKEHEKIRKIVIGQYEVQKDYMCVYALMLRISVYYSIDINLIWFSLLPSNTINKNI